MQADLLSHDALLVGFIVLTSFYAFIAEDRIMASPLDRLKEKFVQARGVAQRVASSMEAEADALIAEEDQMKAATAEAFAPHKAILAEGRKELDAIKDALNLMSNGGPPLTASGSTAPGSPPVPGLNAAGVKEQSNGQA